MITSVLVPPCQIDAIIVRQETVVAEARCAALAATFGEDQQKAKSASDWCEFQEHLLHLAKFARAAL